jgi:hypothetical protein
MSMPGTPIIYYGDEIGMGDNIYLGDRNGVPTPMQGSPRINAGFSQADPERLYAPVISNAVHGYQAVNVDAQERSEHSLLNWMKSLTDFLPRTALLAAVDAGHPSAKILSWSIRFVIWILAITMTLEELGLARQTVISAFSIVFGAAMLGLAIAFGLGGQDLARKALERYFGDAKKDREKDKEPQPL